MNAKLPEWKEAAGTEVSCSRCDWTSFIALGEVQNPMIELIRRLNDHNDKYHPEWRREEFVRELLR